MHHNNQEAAAEEVAFYHSNFNVKEGWNASCLLLKLFLNRLQKTRQEILYQCSFCRLITVIGFFESFDHHFAVFLCCSSQQMDPRVRPRISASLQPES